MRWMAITPAGLDKGLPTMEMDTQEKIPWVIPIDRLHN